MRPGARPDRIGRIAAGHLADVAVRVHKAGNDREAGDIDYFSLWRNTNITSGTDRSNPVSIHDENTILYERPGDGHDAGSDKCFRRRLCRLASQQEAGRQQDRRDRTAKRRCNVPHDDALHELRAVGKTKK